MLNVNDGLKGLCRATFLGLLAPALSAQSLSLPASDPVGIGRLGAGVAFGRSLEAASLNPALLTTLTEPRSAYLSLGAETLSTQVTFQGNQQTHFSTDRNRLLPAFGAAWRLNERTALGFKVDVPFLRHGLMGPDSSARFLGDEVDLQTLRAELQLARSFGSEGQVSLGASLGAMKIDLTQGTVVRAMVGSTPTQAVSPTNASYGLAETRVTQQGSATVGTFSMGFRWAVNPRWTVGASAQGFTKASLAPKAELGSRPIATVNNDGFSTADLGTSDKAKLMLAASSPVAGKGNVALPGRATFGVRHRMNNLFTVELDLKYTRMASLELPTASALATPSGLVQNQPGLGTLRNTMAYVLAGELALTKNWTLRGGYSLEQGFRKDGDVEPLLGGAKTSSFSFGAGVKAMGGEWTFGYQARLSQDQDNSHLEGAWNSTGYHSAPGLTRVEGMGHLLSIGFRKTF